MRFQNRAIICISIIAVCFVSTAQGSWQGPTELISGSWGKNKHEFGMRVHDSGEEFGGPFFVLIDGRLFVTDEVNNRTKIYSPKGELLEVIECVRNAAGELNDKCRIPYGYIQTTPDGNVWVGPAYLKQQRYTLYSPSGQAIRTEIGSPNDIPFILSSREYPDKNVSRVMLADASLTIESPSGLEGVVLDVKGYLYGTVQTGDPIHYRVYKYGKCGNAIDFIDLPVRNVIVEPDTIPPKPTPDYTVIADYGTPVIGPNGDVYTWKRSPDKYSILKWNQIDNSVSGKGVCSERPAEKMILPFAKKNYSADKRLYTQEDIEVWKAQKVEYTESEKKLIVTALRNEMYARHGREFENPEIKYIFQSVSWYKPRDSFSDSDLNEFERKNVELILQYEKQKGWRQ